MSVKTRLTTSILSVSAAVAAVTLATAPSASAALALNAQTRSCAEGVRPAAQGYAMDAVKFSSGSIRVDGYIKDSCTDGQNAVIYMREITVFGDATTDWTWVRSGASTGVPFGISMVQRGLVSDIQVKVCRTGADAACSDSRYLHV